MMMPHEPEKIVAGLGSYRWPDRVAAIVTLERLGDGQTWYQVMALAVDANYSIKRALILNFVRLAAELPTLQVREILSRCLSPRSGYTAHDDLARLLIEALVNHPRLSRGAKARVLNDALAQCLASSPLNQRTLIYLLRAMGGVPYQEFERNFQPALALGSEAIAFEVLKTVVAMGSREGAMRLGPLIGAKNAYLAHLAATIFFNSQPAKKVVSTFARLYARVGPGVRQRLLRVRLKSDLAAQGQLYAWLCQNESTVDLQRTALSALGRTDTPEARAAIVAGSSSLPKFSLRMAAKAWLLIHQGNDGRRGAAAEGYESSPQTEPASDLLHRQIIARRFACRIMPAAAPFLIAFDHIAPDMARQIFSKMEGQRDGTTVLTATWTLQQIRAWSPRLRFLYASALMDCGIEGAPLLFFLTDIADPAWTSCHRAMTQTFLQRQPEAAPQLVRFLRETYATSPHLPLQWEAIFSRTVPDVWHPQDWVDLMASVLVGFTCSSAACDQIKEDAMTLCRFGYYEWQDEIAAFLSVAPLTLWPEILRYVRSCSGTLVPRVRDSMLNILLGRAEPEIVPALAELASMLSDDEIDEYTLRILSFPPSSFRSSALASLRRPTASQSGGLRLA